MQHLGQFAALLMAMSTLGQLTTGQPTVDSELMNEGCDGSDGGVYVALLEEVLAGQRRLESKLQHLRQSNDDGFETPESHLSVSCFYRAMLCRTRLCHSMSSVCPSTFKYRDQLGWKTSKIILRLSSFRFSLGLVPTWTIWSNGNTPYIRVEQGWGSVSEQKTCNISETRQGGTKVT